VQAVGATVLGYDPFVAPQDAGGIALVGLDELLAGSDTVTLHARMTPQTAGMIGVAELAVMKRGAILVNTARGGLLDYDAAVAALRSGRLGALALDVYPTEPLPLDSPLLRMDRVVLSPHLAGATRQTAACAAAIAADEVSRYVDRQPLRHVVNGIRPGGAP
jgi:D-3-phosphoglycerate dehydrogenase